MMDRLLENDMVLRILAILVALAVWVQVNDALGVSPKPVQRRVPDVPIVWSVPPPNLTVIGVRPSTVTVEIQGQPNTIGTVANAWVNLGAVTAPGTYSEVAAASVPAGATVVQVLPREVVVTVAALETRHFRADLVQVGSPPGGYGVVTMGAVDRTVSVSGAAPYVHQVRKVMGKVSVVGQQTSFTEQVLLFAVNAQGKAVGHVQLSPDILTVPVTIAAEKTVPVVVRYNGKPSAGFTVSGIRASPATVTVTGPASLLAGIAAVDTHAVSVSGANRTVTTTATLSLPTGVQAVGPSTVKVTITIGAS